MKSLREVIENIKKTKEDIIPIEIFKLNDSYEEDKEFISELMSSKYGNGVYRFPNKEGSQSSYMEQAKLILFYNTQEQLIFGWGLLDDVDATKKQFIDVELDKNSKSKGPFLMNDLIRKIMPSSYENGKCKKGEEKYDKKFYKFKWAELLKVPFNYKYNISNDLQVKIIIDDMYENVILSDYKGPSQSSFEKAYINKANINVLEQVLLKKSLKINSIFELQEYPSSLMEQIDLYSIENVHTNFLKNYINSNNIYGLANKSMDSYLKLIINDLPAYYSKKEYNNEEILSDSYEIKPQKRLQFESGKKIQPDLVLEGKIYRIIIEVKYYSTENKDQTKEYFKYFDELNDKKKNIYVFLSLLPVELLSIEKEKNEIIFKRISFKDLLNKVYLKNYLQIRKNRYILDDYIKSFIFTVDPLYSIDIEYIPVVDIKSFKLKKAEKLYNVLLKYEVPNNCFVKFNNLKEVITAKYLLVLLYNSTENSNKKEKIKRMYKSLKVI